MTSLFVFTYFNPNLVCLVFLPGKLFICSIKLHKNQAIKCLICRSNTYKKCGLIIISRLSGLHYKKANVMNCNAVLICCFLFFFKKKADYILFLICCKRDTKSWLILCQPGKSPLSKHVKFYSWVHLLKHVFFYSKIQCFFLFCDVCFTEQIINWDYSGNRFSVFKNSNLQIYSKNLQ